MRFYHTVVICFIKLSFLINISKALYIKNSADVGNNKLTDINNINKNDEWNIFKQKLGLTNQKVELLKSQKDQQGTMELLNRFIEENTNYNSDKVKNEKKTADKTSNNFLKVYHDLLKQLKLSRRTLKTSLNFELSENPQKSLKRSRRKIAVKMVSDMPSEKIDELLEMFNEKHDINKQDKENDDADINKSEAVDDYKEFSFNLPSAMDPDYMYENLYEDEEDLAVPAKSNHNSQYGSLQDLILQATRNQWQREREETKLRNRKNEHFI